MTIATFSEIPSPFYVPGQYAEFNNTNANSTSPILPQNGLLIGQMLTGTATAGKVTRVFSADQVGALCGRGSQVHQMAKAWYAGNLFTPCFILPLADADESTESARTITVTGPSTAAGELDIYIGGTRYAIGVASGASATTVAAAIVAAVQADTDRYLDTAVDGTDAYKVDITARHGGIDAGNIDVSHSQNDGEAVPPGLTVTISALTAGTLNPDLESFLGSNLGSTWFTQFVQPYTDSTNITAMNDEMLNRFGPIVQKDCGAFTGLALDLDDAVAKPATINSQLTWFIDTSDELSPSFVVAAAVAAQDAGFPTPQQPRATLPLPGIVPHLDDGSRLDIPSQQQLLAAGVGTLYIDEAGVVRIQRLVTSYRTNEYGQPDNSYFNVETLHILANIRYSWNLRLAQKYPQMNLGQNGSIGSTVVTPNDLQNEAICIYQDTWMPNSWVQGGAALQAFIANTTAVINSSDADRCDMYLPPQTMRFLYTQATEIAFS